MTEITSSPARRINLIAATALVLVVVLAVAAFLVVRQLSDPAEPGAQQVVPDTAGRAPGQAQAYTDSLRNHGLVCSDRYLDYTPVLVRGCYRKDAAHEVMVDFAATPDGKLGWASVQVDYLNANDEASAETDLEAVAGEFAEAASLAGVAELVKKNGTHRTAWGTVWTDGADVGGIGTVTVLRDGWEWPELPAEHLTSTAEQIATIVAGRGYACTETAKPSRVTTCTKQAGGAITVRAHIDGNTLTSFTLAVEGTTQPHPRALDELKEILSLLTGGRALQVRQWFETTGQVPGGRAQVAGLQVCQVTDGEKVNFEITSFRPYARWTGDC